MPDAPPKAPLRRERRPERGQVSASRNEEFLNLRTIIEAISRRRVRSVVPASPEEIGEVVCRVRGEASVGLGRRATDEDRIERALHSSNPPSGTKVGDRGGKKRATNKCRDNGLDGDLVGDAHDRDSWPKKPLSKTRVGVGQQRDCVSGKPEAPLL